MKQILNIYLLKSNRIKEIRTVLSEIDEEEYPYIILERELNRLQKDLDVIEAWRIPRDTIPEFVFNAIQSV